MDVLTHLFLPITVALAVRPDLFPSPAYLSFGVFAVLPDFDKLLGMPGLLHSLLAIILVAAGAFGITSYFERSNVYATLATLLVASHLVLDFLDGGPITLFYPFIKTGIGLTYPTQIIFGDAVHEVAVRNPVPKIRVGAANASRDAYPLINGYGVLSGVMLLVVYVGLSRWAGETNNEPEMKG